MTLQKQLVWLKASAAKVPDAEGVSSTLALVTSGAPYDQLFFGELKDAAWLPLLERKGYFSTQLSDDEEVNRRSAHKHRLPLFALTRFAETAPECVAAILLRIPLASAQTNADQILRCLAGIRDRRAITSVRPLAVYLAETTHRIAAVWIDELLKSWIVFGAEDEAKGVLRAFIAATVNEAPKNQPPYDNHWQVGEIDRKVVEQLTKKSPLDIAVIYFEALSRWAALRRAYEEARFDTPWAIEDEKDPARDTPNIYWLEDFKSARHDSRDLEETLACRLFSTCAQVFGAANPKQIAYLESLLRSDRWELFTRLRWQLYADFPSQTLQLARQDVLGSVPYFGRIEYSHGFEFAQLLKKHADAHGTAFLTADEIAQITSSVFAGPLDHQGQIAEISKREVFWRKQLQPLTTLLPEAVRNQLKSEHHIEAEDYKPIRSGGARMIEQVSPLTATDLAAKSNAELWDFLNTWKPTGRSERTDWWIEENADALAATFASVVEQNPERFKPETNWWTNLKRPVMLYRILDRATERVSSQAKDVQAASATDWANWLSLADWIITHAPPVNIEKREIDRESDWSWSSLSVARFLKAAVNVKTPESSQQTEAIKRLLRIIVQADDPRLDRKETSIGDWLTTAINSARGDAMEAILDLALQEHKDNIPIEPWIFETIQERLKAPNESPAIFALFGSRLRLMVYLFGKDLKQIPELLFPPERPKHHDAAVLAHFQYDNPMPGVIESFPSIVDAGLALLKESYTNKNEQKGTRREFDSRLGMHIAFYYWNSALPNDPISQEALDKFFTLASSNARASVIDQIGSVFEKAIAEEVPEKTSNRVMQIWERRFEQIVGLVRSSNLAPTDYQSELSAFTDWIRCECFPLDWRVRRVVSALNMLRSGSQPYRLIKYIGDQSDKPERLLDMLKVLEALLRQPNDEMRWSMQEKEIRPLLERAFASHDPEIKMKAGTTLELLLRQGFLSFLDIDRELSSSK